MIKLALIFNLTFLNSLVKAKECKALVLAGGGTRGAYQAGVLWSLVKNDPDKTKFAYDVVSGVSAGSLNALALSFFEPG